ncbi:MAG: hypothetical protein EB054_04950 [Actinobacteria bacterium]|nr:hypothetical protein [Actinomycetota bacterium]
MLPTPYVASLRVYEAIEAFDTKDQERWRKMPLESQTKSEEQKKALIRTITSSSPYPLLDGAHILDVDGKLYVSPWSTAQRSWAALSDFKASMPPNVSKFFLPNLQELDQDLTSINSVNRVSHVLSETWVVPPRWFALFEPEERLVGRNSGIAFSIARAEMNMAKQRCIKAHLAVRNAFGVGPVEEEIVQLLNWLNNFNPQSIVELDYGGLAQYLDKSLRSEGESGIESDTSIEDVKTSLSGLAAGDGALAGSGYEKLVSRWRKVAAYQQAM